MTWRLYGTQGCHLCDMAEDLLARAATVHGAKWEYVDIALDPELVVLYGERIPVLQTDNNLMFWPFSLLDLSASVENTQDVAS